jgi:hypothetical protein
MAMPTLSWMGVAIGDPLYRPYASWLQLDRRADTSNTSADWRMYHEFAVANAAKASAEFRALARTAAIRAKNGPMLEDLGLMEAHDGNQVAATSFFAQARTIYSTRDDLIRVIMEEADSWLKQNKPERAADLVRSAMRIVTGAPTIALLRRIEEQASTARPARIQRKR